MRSTARASQKSRGCRERGQNYRAKEPAAADPHCDRQKYPNKDTKDIGAYLWSELAEDNGWARNFLLH